MVATMFQGLTAVLLVPEVWLLAPLWGALLLFGGARFLSAGYRGSQSVFDRHLSFTVFLGTSIFLLLAGPAMLFGPGQSTAFWLDAATGEIRFRQGAIVLASGIIIAGLFRMILPLPRIWSCYPQALFVLAAIGWLRGVERIIPGAGAMAVIVVVGILMLWLSQLCLDPVIERLQEGGFLSSHRRYHVQASIATTPFVLCLALAPYASWLMIVNGLRGGH